jgi:hypothetical protein
VHLHRNLNQKQHIFAFQIAPVTAVICLTILLRAASARVNSDMQKPGQYRMQINIDRSPSVVHDADSSAIISALFFSNARAVDTMTRQNLSSISYLPLVGFFCAVILTGCVTPTGDKDETSDSASTAPAVAGEPAESGLPTSEQWANLRNCEASGRYDISSRDGKYHGAYQFSQTTWNATARSAGREDLVGVKPSEASREDQDRLAVALFRERGSQPWGPKCGAFLN